ncbi:MAG: hypothetical protein CUN54_05160 [Phototrophicales bacterium]|nr:MAG: hypothetical protein CUN54_05160 [Phototrophicales bacterium]
MKSILSKPLQHIVRRGQVGQSIIIVALGFLGLLGFVGIVTDVSLMFVRFTSLRRAVDSAAVGAASQIRRLPEPAGGPPGEGIARNIAQANLAARQLIQFHGLDPNVVLVQTCATERGNDPELCTADQRKLIRVTAQVESPTIFMRLLGFPSLTLEASAISETAALDVVLIFDVSESMLNETTYEDWANAGFNAVYVPKRIRDVAAASGLDRWTVTPFLYDLSQTQGQGILHNWANLSTACQNDSRCGGPVDFSPEVFAFPGSPATITEPRPACRVRYFPNTWTTDVADDVWTIPGFQSRWTGGGSRRYDGYINTYNFYGCCNDPDGNLVFDDLICQPFKDARDAAFDFLNQIDFIRGDRVAFVTFDRQAFLVRADAEDNNPTVAPNAITHMIDNQAMAEGVLNSNIGVRTEPSFYEPNIDSASGLPVMPWRGFANESGPVDYDNDLGLHDYPVNANCTFADAALPTVTGTDTLRDIEMPPSWAVQDPFFTYTYWAQCRGTNIGGALATAGQALTDPATTRTTGTVWTMVLLSDGAAGGTDPVRRNGSMPAQADPYNSSGPLPGVYGAYGACPYGDPSREITRLGVFEATSPNINLAPHCIDNTPETRHFCNGVIVDGGFTGVAMDDSDPNCDIDLYNADDYARDWADFIGLDNSDTGNVQLPIIFTIGFGLQPSDCSSPAPEEVPDCLGVELLRYIADVGDNFQIDTDYQQLYTTFGPLGPASGSIEQLRADGEFGGRGPCEQDLGQVISPPNSNVVTVEDFRRSQGVNPTWNQLIAPRPPTENCGNYFNATADRASLSAVFDTIAQRMFVRIAS